MEESLISTNCMSRALSPSDRAEYPCGDEESGWTVYLEDFTSNKKIDTDAACSASSRKHRFDDDDDELLQLSLHRGRDERICSKKRKTNSSDVVDGDLEDTASSPVHSPKVNDLNRFLMNMKSTDMNVQGNRQEKGSAFDQTGQGIQFGFIGKDSNYTELRKKGLCLVPMSLLVNYVS